MANVALGKPVIENVGKRNEATDGNATKYTAFEGFAYFNWPGTLTVDLGQSHRLSCIRFLLWDGLGEPGSVRNPRVYLYRLLVSTDLKNWKVLHDTGVNGYNGWQEFLFHDSVEARYVRIHGIWNIANRQFHIVEVEAHDSDPPPLVVRASVRRGVSSEAIQSEQGDGLPWSDKVLGLIASLDEAIEKYKVLNPEPFRDLISQLRVQVADISALESNMDAIRREITAPVATKLRNLSTIGNWQFILGFGSLLVTIALSIIG